MEGKLIVKENRDKFVKTIEKKQQYTLQVFNRLIEKREAKLMQQKLKNEEKYQKLQERLKIANIEREKINDKSKERQGRYKESAELRKLLKKNTMRERSQSQMMLFEMNQERKGKIREEICEKFRRWLGRINIKYRREWRVWNCRQQMKKSIRVK